MSDFLSPEDLAKRYGVPLSTVYSWNLKSTGPRPYKFGRHVRYLASEVDAWEKSRASDRQPAA